MSELQRTLTTSALMVTLERQLAEHGDLPVYLVDPDTSWLLGVAVVYEPGGRDSNHRPYIAIEAVYRQEA
jgi:hypothetical protein